SGRSSPVMRLNSVDFPAPFGPIMPSASPRATSSATPSTAFSEPNDRARLSSLRITSIVALVSAAISGVSECKSRCAHAGYLFTTSQALSLKRSRICDAAPWRCISSGKRPLEQCRSSGNRLHLAAGRNFRRGLVVGDDDVVLAAVTQPPLTADQ